MSGYSPLVVPSDLGTRSGYRYAERGLHAESAFIVGIKPSGFPLRQWVSISQNFAGRAKMRYPPHDT